MGTLLKCIHVCTYGILTFLNAVISGIFTMGTHWPLQDYPLIGFIAWWVWNVGCIYAIAAPAVIRALNESEQGPFYHEP